MEGVPQPTPILSKDNNDLSCRAKSRPSFGLPEDVGMHPFPPKDLRGKNLKIMETTSWKRRCTKLEEKMINDDVQLPISKIHGCTALFLGLSGIFRKEIQKTAMKSLSGHTFPSYKFEGG